MKKEERKKHIQCICQFQEDFFAVAFGDGVLNGRQDKGPDYRNKKKTYIHFENKAEEKVADENREHQWRQ